ncbi:hypothetical protein HK101_006518, partial [Irineochytrium annulatum]
MRLEALREAVTLNDAARFAANLGSYFNDLQSLPPSSRFAGKKTKKKKLQLQPATDDQHSAAPAESLAVNPHLQLRRTLSDVPLHFLMDALDSLISPSPYARDPISTKKSIRALGILIDVSVHGDQPPPNASDERARKRARVDDPASNKALAAARSRLLTHLSCTTTPPSVAVLLQPLSIELSRLPEQHLALLRRLSSAAAWPEFARVMGAYGPPQGMDARKWFDEEVMQQLQEMVGAEGDVVTLLMLALPRQWGWVSEEDAVRLTAVDDGVACESLKMRQWFLDAMDPVVFSHLRFIADPNTVDTLGKQAVQEEESRVGRINKALIGAIEKWGLVDDAMRGGRWDSILAMGSRGVVSWLIGETVRVTRTGGEKGEGEEEEPTEGLLELLEMVVEEVRKREAANGKDGTMNGMEERDTTEWVKKGHGAMVRKEDGEEVEKKVRNSDLLARYVLVK